MRGISEIKRNKTTHYTQCLDDLFELDLSDYLPLFYNPGDRILGDLKRLGWVLLRGVRIDKETQYSLDTISSSDKCHPIEKYNRSIKSNLGGTIHGNWRTDNWMVTLMRSIKTEFFNISLPNRNYCLGKYNLLKND